MFAFCFLMHIEVVGVVWTFGYISLVVNTGCSAGYQPVNRCYTRVES